MIHKSLWTCSNGHFFMASLWDDEETSSVDIEQAGDVIIDQLSFGKFCTRCCSKIIRCEHEPTQCESLAESAQYFFEIVMEQSNLESEIYRQCATARWN